MSFVPFVFFDRQMTTRRFHAALLFLLILSGAILMQACGSDAGPAAKKGDSTVAVVKGPDGKPVATVSEEAVPGEAAAASPQIEAFKGGEPVSDPAVLYSFRLKPTAGESYGYRIIQDNDTELEGVRLSERIVYNFTVKITGVNTDGSITMEMRYDSIRMKRSFPPGVIDSVARTVTYDTRQKADPKVPGTESIKALVGQTVNMTISNTGDVREVSNLEPIVSSIVTGLNLPDTLPAQYKAKAREQVRATIKVQAFSSVVQQLFMQNPPDNPVASGGTWNRKDTVPLFGLPSQSTITYALTDVRSVDGRPVGHVTATMDTKFPSKKIETQMLSAVADEARVDGGADAILDLVSGFPLQKKTKIDVLLKVTGKPKVGPNKGKSGSMSQRMISNVVVERTDYKPAAE
jgi:hypothetical protein